jgi:thioredoxin reductase
MNTLPHFDAIVIGGSYAGMSAALQLARARRRVLVVDAGERRNRFAHASHGFLTNDGRSPEAIFAEARAQLMLYDTVTWIDGTVSAAKKVGEHFAVTTAAGENALGSRLLLATGVIDHVPDVEGLVERWGTHVFHCPYCHGYELHQGDVGVIAGSDASHHHAMMLPDWGRTTLFTNGCYTPDDKQRAALLSRGVTIETSLVRRISGTCTVELEDGRSLDLVGVFVITKTTLASPLAEQLGCALEEGAVGPYVTTDDKKETTVKGVYACGDTARTSGSLALAVGEGALAGVAVHQSLVFR